MSETIVNNPKRLVSVMDVNNYNEEMAHEVTPLRVQVPDADAD